VLTAALWHRLTEVVIVYRGAARAIPALTRGYLQTVISLTKRAGLAAWRRRPAPRSLRRAATVDRWWRIRAPFREKVVDVGRSIWAAASVGVRPFIWLSLATLVPLLLPIPSGWALHPFTGADGAHAAQNFLQTLWQVDAAAIGLSLAVALFAFEAIRDAEKRGSLVRFATETHLSFVLALGIAAILNLGAVLLGLGSGAPGGFAATWTCLVSLAALVSLPFLLQGALTSTTRRRRGERRRRETHEATVAATEEEIFRRIAMLRLTEEAKAAGVELRGQFLASPAPGEERIYSRRQGRIVDIRLSKLRRLGKHGNRRIKLLVDFGASVKEDTPVALIPADASRGERHAVQKLLQVKHRESQADVLREELEWLHESALEAIRSGLPKTYEEITDEYIEALTALPAAWQRIGETYNAGAAQGLGLFDLTPLDRFVENLWHEMREAFTGSHLEVAGVAVGLPYHVASRAVDVDAAALFMRMLGLYVSIYSEAKNAPDPAVKRRVHHACIDLPLELTKLRVAYRVADKETDDATRETLSRYLTAAQIKIADLARTAMDVDPTDTATLSRINRGWTDLFHHWTPEREGPDQWDVDHARQTLGRDHPDTLALEAQLTDRLQMIALKKEAELLRDSLRFGLAYWAHRRLLTTQDEKWVGPFTEFRQYFGSVQRLTAAFGQASRVEDETWFVWLMQDTTGSAWGPNLDWEMLKTYFTIAIFIVPPQLPEPGTRRPVFLGTQTGEARQLLLTVANDSKLWSALDAPPDMARRVAVVWRMFRRAS
jgi:hypothetical protein